MNEARGKLAGVSKPLSDIKVRKLNSCVVKPIDDYPPGCLTTGMAITKDKQWLLVDKSSDIVKLFSQNMEFLSSIELPDGAQQIAVVDDQEAVVTNGKKKLVTLDISDAQRGQLSIKCTRQLEYSVHGITSYKDKLLVTSYYPLLEIPSVKLIDQTGRVYWSVSNHQLFGKPSFVCCNGDNAVVSDSVTDTLTLLKAETGELVTTHCTQSPRGITTDMAGNIYVIFYWSEEVAVLTRNLAEERILLTSGDGIRFCPFAIAYDDAENQLIVSYISGKNIDCFKFF